MVMLFAMILCINRNMAVSLFSGKYASYERNVCKEYQNNRKHRKQCN
ncbi:hypothetical protein ECANGB1_2714 [Enterospora canceri]|uniref:Uncharacterized protein n=1 Tax=Enterospora canceri TaxID=1081671 RepID=A0A1Y1S4S4_9MICR|nr:hypothetical protein ECANGB1_2728 [Enterospora canceri]ORD93704.1 hypothetical protein ECANGB1_2714 [Enterospora canceri]